MMLLYGLGYLAVVVITDLLSLLYAVRTLHHHHCYRVPPQCYVTDASDDETV